MSNLRSDLDSSLDQSYVQKMQFMSLNGTDGDPRYGRIMGKAEPAVPPYHQKQKSIGAIESFTSEGPAQTKQNDYTLYERNNIIASSKYATPKQVETLISQKPVEESDIYVQCAKPQVAPNSSPTHSLSGSSQHSSSPRASMAANATPVYENIDYYSGRNFQTPYYHSGDGNFRKAQPQVPAGNRNANRDGEALPVYENLQTLGHKSSGATPGPQVPSNQAPPPYPTQTYQQSFPQMQKLGISKAPYYHANYNKGFTQQQLDEINSSDYVCMTGNISHTLSTNVPFQTSSAKNYNREPATGIASTPSVLPKSPVAKEKIDVRPPPVPSPTPSACSTSSGSKMKISGKTLLPYNVTPPRPRGPTEAERKIEEMTRQIEEEMEKHEEEGEYFGNFLFVLFYLLEKVVARNLSMHQGYYFVLFYYKLKKR
jgi:LIM domain-containing protein